MILQLNYKDICKTLNIKHFTQLEYNKERGTLYISYSICEKEYISIDMNYQVYLEFIRALKNNERFIELDFSDEEYGE